MSALPDSDTVAIVVALSIVHEIMLTPCSVTDCVKVAPPLRSFIVAVKGPGRLLKITANLEKWLTRSVAYCPLYGRSDIVALPVILQLRSMGP